MHFLWVNQHYIITSRPVNALATLESSLATGGIQTSAALRLAWVEIIVMPGKTVRFARIDCGDINVQLYASVHRGWHNQHVAEHLSK